MRIRFVIICINAASGSVCIDRWIYDCTYDLLALLGSGSGSSGGGGGSGSGLHSRSKPAVIELASGNLLLHPHEYLLDGLVAGLPAGELLKHSRVLGKPLDVLEEAAEIGHFSHTLLAAIFVDEFEATSGLGELESSVVLGDHFLHPLHGVIVIDLACLSVSDELLPLLDSSGLDEAVDVGIAHFLCNVVYVVEDLVDVGLRLLHVGVVLCLFVLVSLLLCLVVALFLSLLSLELSLEVVMELFHGST